MRWTLATGMREAFSSKARAVRNAAPSRDRARAWRRRAARPLSCRHAWRRALRRARRADRRRQPCRPCTMVRPATINSFTCCAVARAEQQFDRIEIVAQAVVVDRSPVEQQDIGRRARLDGAAVVPIRHREAAVGESDLEHLLAARTPTWKPVPACSRCASRNSRKPSSSSSNALPSTPERHAAALLQHHRNRRDAGPQMQVGAGC